MKKRIIVILSVLLLVLSGFAAAKLFAQNQEYYLDISDDCGFWFNIEKQHSLVRTIVSGACENIDSRTYLDAFNKVIANEGIDKKGYLVDVFYINIRPEISNSPDFSKFKDEIITAIDNSFEGSYRLEESDLEMLKVVRN